MASSYFCFLFLAVSTIKRLRLCLEYEKSQSPLSSQINDHIFSSIWFFVLMIGSWDLDLCSWEKIILSIFTNIITVPPTIFLPDPFSSRHTECYSKNVCLLFKMVSYLVMSVPCLKWFPIALRMKCKHFAWCNTFEFCVYSHLPLDTHSSPLSHNSPAALALSQVFDYVRLLPASVSVHMVFSVWIVFPFDPFILYLAVWAHLLVLSLNVTISYKPSLISYFIMNPSFHSHTELCYGTS